MYRYTPHAHRGEANRGTNLAAWFGHDGESRGPIAAPIVETLLILIAAFTGSDSPLWRAISLGTAAAMARMMATGFRSCDRSRMKPRSILTLSKGKLCRARRAKQPVPKPAIAIRTPGAFLTQLGQDGCIVAQQHGPGDFQLQPVCRRAAGGQGGAAAADEVPVLELRWREVDGDLHVVRPGQCAHADLVQDPFADDADEA
jgi:hypothetical protein